MSIMKLEASWYQKLKEEIAQPYIQELKNFLLSEKEKGFSIYPKEAFVFHALSQTPFSQVKVVIMGQDPYHGPGQAHGLSFSVPPGVLLPPSLKNIFSELVKDVGVPYPPHGCLISWAKQGVLLLNATLTVREKEPRSHYGKGWERFTDAIIRCLSEKEERIIFILWGKSAQEKCLCLLEKKESPHIVLTAAHPSPYSVEGFFGSRPFSKINQHLKEVGKEPIDWRIF